MSTCTINSPIGRIRIQADQGVVTHVDFLWQLGDEKSSLADPLFQQIGRSITSYFQKPTQLQTIPCKPEGTPFQQRVWQALLKIPLGSVVSYGELARELGSSPRAVGGACRNNPIPLIIPCHRVVSKTGIGGFSGQWGEGEKVNVKQWLLWHECYQG